MSNHLYLQCLSHTPPITNWSESGHNLSDLPQIQEDLQIRDKIVEAVEMGFMPDEQEFFASHRRTTASFLASHPDCDIGIIDENYQSHPVTPKEDE